MQNKSGICRYCGQHRLVEVPDFYTEEQIEEKVALVCNCKAAQAYQAEKEMEEKLEMAKTSAKGTTFELFHEDAPEVEKILNEALEPLTDGAFDSLKIKVNKRTTATLKMSNENILVMREDKSTYKRETETR